MKIIFGTDVTKNKKNEISDELQYISAKVSQATRDSLEKISEEVEAVEKKMGLPLPVKIIHFILGIGLVVSLRLIIKIMTDMPDNVTLNEVFSAKIWVVILFFVSLAGFGLIYFVAQKRYKTVAQSDEHQVTFNRADRVCENAYRELGVTADATDIDIFSFEYKIKNGKIHTKEASSHIYNFANLYYKIFMDGKDLCIADVEQKICLPEIEFIAIEKINKRIYFPLWNKDEEYNKGEYKKYKIGFNDGMYNMKGFCILYVKCKGEDVLMYFPLYELEVIEKITGLRA